MSIRISSSSRYFAATKTTKKDACRKWQVPATASSAHLPVSAIKAIQAILCQQPDITNDMEIRLSVSEQDKFAICHTNSSPVASLLLHSSADALNFIRDLGCKQIDESKVVQIQVVDPPSSFHSSYDGKLVHEVKCLTSVPSHEMLYAIRVLHCMKGTPGFARLVGVVTDDDHRYLKGYLVEATLTRFSLRRIANNPYVSWGRRLKWAIQLVEGFSQLHARGFVIGGSTLRSTPVVTESDSLQFWSFKERFVWGEKVGNIIRLNIATLPSGPQRST